MPSRDRLPRGLARLLRILLPRRSADSALGDLAEEYDALRRRRGRAAAWLWLVREAVSLVVGSWRTRPSRPGTGSRLVIAAAAALAELRHAARRLLRAPGYSAIVVLVLALGIGANAALFSVLNAAVLTPLPYAEPARLVALHTTFEDLDMVLGTSPADLRDIEERSASFTFLGDVMLPSFAERDTLLTGGDMPEPVPAARVSANFFDVLGVEAAIGRTFAPGEDSGEVAVVVLSHRFWSDRFAADPAVVGREIDLDFEPHVVVGVMPEGFRHELEGRSRALWIAPAIEPEMTEIRNTNAFLGIARLAPGVTLEQARSELASIERQLRREHPEEFRDGGSFGLTPLQEFLVGDLERPLLGLLAAALAVLLVGCASLANMMLARASRRGGEVAVRLALGAGRARVVTHLLAEPVLLALGGGLLGLLGGLWIVDVAVARAPFPMPAAGHVGLDWRLAGFVLGVSLLVGVLIGLVPALRASGGRVHQLLRSSGIPGAGRSRIPGLRSGDLLVVGESALVLVLLVAAGLTIQSVDRMLDVEPGFAVEGRLAVELSLPWTKYSWRDLDGIARFLERAETELETLPGVRQVGSISRLPLDREAGSANLWIQGRAGEDGPPVPAADHELVSPGYFDAAGVPLLRGRTFDEGDRSATTPVAVINETMARRHWPDGDALGARISDTSAKGPWMTVVGIVGDVKQRSLDTPARPQVYLPHAQQYGGLEPHLLVWTDAADPRELFPGVRESLRRLEPDLAIAGVQPLGDRVRESVAEPRFAASLLSVFAVITLAVGLAGVYGVVSQGVGRRTGEIGLRVAVGARARQIVRLVLGQSLVPVAAGLLVGAAGAVGVGHLLTEFLFASPSVLGITAVTAAFVTVAASLAILVPARRASRVDPVTALKTAD